MSYPCITCKKNVQDRDEALQCETCNGWNHRRCGTGISRALYRQLVRGDEDLDWWCNNCGIPEEITPDVDQTADLDDTPEPLPPLEETTEEPPETDVVPPPEILLEESIEDPSIREEDMVVDDGGPHFIIVQGASQRGGPLLTDSRGFTFTLKRKYKDTVYWWCSVRSQTLFCHATVVQKGEDFHEGKQPHSHPAKPGIDNAVKITTMVKETAKQNVRDSARRVVEEVLQDVDINAPNPSRPNPNTLIRKANRVRETLRPKDPKDLDFQLNHDFLPDDFVVGDVRNHGERHLIMATKTQLQLLADSKVWYLDGTFKVVRSPFYQLFSIHCFLRSGDSTKQVPVAFVLMSRRRTSDYRAVLREILSLLPRRPAVRKVVLDYEMAMWKACETVLPGAVLSGCSFHWTQAVFRKAQELALQGPYRKREAVHLYVRRVLALVYLPAECIPVIFERLKTKASTTALQDLMAYVENQWIGNAFWKPEKWSVYGQATRTNNDVEGWHRHLNDKAGEAQLGVYRLVPLLHTEAEQIPLQRLMVSEGKLCSLQRKKTRSHQAKLFKVWELYQLENITAFQLMKRCAMLIKRTFY